MRLPYPPQKRMPLLNGRNPTLHGAPLRPLTRPHRHPRRRTRTLLRRNRRPQPKRTHQRRSPPTSPGNPEPPTRPLRRTVRLQRPPRLQVRPHPLRNRQRRRNAPANRHGTHGPQRPRLRQSPTRRPHNRRPRSHRTNRRSPRRRSRPIPHPRPQRDLRIAGDTFLKKSFPPRPLQKTFDIEFEIVRQPTEEDRAR